MRAFLGIWLPALAGLAIVYLLVRPGGGGGEIITSLGRLGIGITKAVQGNAPTGSVYGAGGGKY